MCNVRYEYTTNNNNNNNFNNSLLEVAFEHEYRDYMGFCYKCKLCDTVLKSTLDAWLHLRNYHNIKTLEDYKTHEELKKTINETTKQEQKQEEKKQEQNDNKIVIKKVVKPRPKTILDFIRGDKNAM
jgi:hypothetical protein